MMNAEITQENIVENCQIALKVEGKEYLIGVKSEILEIIDSNDKRHLKKISRRFNLKWMGLDMNKMEFLLKTINNQTK